MISASRTNWLFDGSAIMSLRQPNSGAMTGAGISVHDPVSFTDLNDSVGYWQSGLRTGRIDVWFEIESRNASGAASVGLLFGNSEDLTDDAEIGKLTWTVGPVVVPPSFDGSIRLRVDLGLPGLRDAAQLWCGLRVELDADAELAVAAWLSRRAA